MTKYKLEEYNILSVKSYRLLEEETGEYWYPLTLFIKKILFRNINTVRYRDDDKYNKYMRVIEYSNPDSAVPHSNKTWFINTEGLYLLLKNISPAKGNTRKQVMQEKYLAAAQGFLGGVVSKNAQNFIGYIPDLTNYDVWSIMCLTRDTTINQNTIWKRCSKCGFYYPNTKRYFNPKKKKYLYNKCKQCCGQDFTCENKRLQYIYKNDGLDLIYQLYLDSDKVVDELKKWINGGGV